MVAEEVWEKQVRFRGGARERVLVSLFYIVILEHFLCNQTEQENVGSVGKHHICGFFFHLFDCVCVCMNDLFWNSNFSLKNLSSGFKLEALWFPVFFVSLVHFFSYSKFWYDELKNFSSFFISGRKWKWFLFVKFVVRVTFGCTQFFLLNELDSLFPVGRLGFLSLVLEANSWKRACTSEWFQRLKARFQRPEYERKTYSTKYSAFRFSWIPNIYVIQWYGRIRVGQVAINHNFLWKSPLKTWFLQTYPPKKWHKECVNCVCLKMMYFLGGIMFNVGEVLGNVILSGFLSISLCILFGLSSYKF